MNGLMMDVPLTITSIVRHAERVHGHKEIVSITRDNFFLSIIFEFTHIHNCTDWWISIRSNFN